MKLFEEIYAQIRAEERRHTDWRRGMEAAGQMLGRMIAKRNMAYEEFIFSI